MADMRNGTSWLLLIASAWLACAPAAAQGAAASYEDEHVALHLDAASPAEDGRGRAALTIDLAPGWKTYWIDPGDSGVPPTLDVPPSGAVALSRIRFPAPHRSDDGYGQSNGYTGTVGIALDYTTRPNTPDAVLAIDVTLGVCREICIPVSASLAARLGDGNVSRIAAAFDGLPQTSTADAGILGAQLAADAQSVDITTALPNGDGEPDLFVAATGGWYFGAPRSVARAGGGRLVFTVPVLQAPRKADPDKLALDVVLTRGDAAWEARELAATPKAD
ncbi:protein-disulfide reductase DsbD family protein [Aurantimonas sp. MSK8Z-1]|uniref:protein-disulfide reductase DsbD domain-containing protein n=1 Tax=Mangrovibrevibacter kandeliae TaxID=2968473 RepID=UPI0021174C32|nr:protein-disulfide reductase DsbD domain-containing protein [Aurantimonas sp. MSK8Z-1]MCW4113520.1 protein-disulfide reductase DsbD family protein [Aurantimonas sp. MSK8Z-1]